MSIIEQLEDLKEEYTSERSQLRLERMKKNYKINKAMLELRDNIAMKVIEKQVVDAINTVNSKLLSEDKMTEHERDLLLTDRERCEWFMRQFSNADRSIENIKEFIKKYDKR